MGLFLYNNWIFIILGYFTTSDAENPQIYLSVVLGSPSPKIQVDLDCWEHMLKGKTYPTYIKQLNTVHST